MSKCSFVPLWLRNHRWKNKLVLSNAEWSLNPAFGQEFKARSSNS